MYNLSELAEAAKTQSSLVYCLMFSDADDSEISSVMDKARVCDEKVGAAKAIDKVLEYLKSNIEVTPKMEAALVQIVQELS